MVQRMLDASGIIHVDNNFFLVAEDEVDILQYFILDMDKHTFKASGQVIDFGHYESDFESLAFDAKTQRFYCIGSHGDHYSQRLLSFSLRDSELADSFEIPFAADRLLDDVDIESLTVWNSHLLIGYRSPSRNKLALAAVFDIQSGTQLLTSFDLNGRVFRDMVCIDEGNYLILAGPQRGKDYKKKPSRIFWWNGNLFAPDLVMCDVDLKGFRAEGIATRLQADGHIDILIGSDESSSKSADSFRMLYLHSPDIASLLTDAHKLVELEVRL